MILRLLLALLLVSGALYAKQNDTCYSVQLASHKKSENFNIEDMGYPKSCKSISFATANAVRCGCFNRYGDAKRQQKVFSPKYPKSLIMKTKRYRFAPKRSIVHAKKASPVVEPVITQKEEVQDIQEEVYVDEVEVVSEDSFLQEIVIQGNVNLTAQSYITKPAGKNRDNYTATAELELAYSKDNMSFFTQFRAQQDYYDIEGGSKKTDRSYIRLNELYLKYDLENSQIFFGKNIRFWGALEVHNLTDGFNISDIRSDPAEKDKLGSWNAAYTYYTDSGELSVIAKFYEEDRNMPDYPYLYYPFEGNNISYDNGLETEKSRTKPSIYLKYSASTDTEYTLDYSIIFEHGYDSQRYYNTPVAPNYEVTENAYIVNKLMTYNTLVVNSTLYKLEATYAKVDTDANIADYYNIGLGIEHTLTQVYDEADLGLLLEYYKYETINRDSNQYTSDQLFEVFQNDIFIGARYSFNQGDDASIIGGATIDLDEDEQAYYVEYESRINDLFKLNIDYRQTEPYTGGSGANQTALSRMGRQKRVSVKVGYYF